jgi:hypothetical protein
MMFAGIVAAWLLWHCWFHSPEDAANTLVQQSGILICFVIFFVILTC